MTALRDTPIKRKLMIITMLTSGVALLLASLTIVTWEQMAFRRGMASEISVLADMFDDNVASGLTFNDAKSIETTLLSLSANTHILAATVYDKNGIEVARYQRADLAGRFVVPAAREPGTHFSRDRLETFRPIILADEQIGNIYIASDLQELTDRLFRYGIIVGVVLLLSSLVALALSSQLQRIISVPISSLASVVNRVATDKDYSLRAGEHGKDELGRLIDGFNEMLNQIQTRDSALQEARHHLEQRVAHRTEELQRENTERKRAETFLNSVVQNLPMMVFIKEPKELRFVLWNKAGEELYGLTNEQLVGRNDYDMFPREMADQFTAKDREALKTGKLVEMEEEISTPGGKRILHTRKIPIVNELGEPLYVLGIAEDITQRKQAEAALAYEQNLLQSLMDNSPDYIYFKDLQSRFIKCSNTLAAGFGLRDSSETVGKTDFDFFDEDHARDSYTDEQEVIRTGLPIVAKVEKEIWKDGNRVTWALTNKVPLRNAARDIIGTFGISKDITQMKEAEAKLEEVHAQLLETSRQAGMAEVATGVLHNVGNVLNSVNVSTTLVAEQIQKSKVANLAKAVALMNEHSSDLGSFMTHDAKGKQLPVYLNQLAAHLSAEQATLANEIDQLRKNVEHIKDIVAMQQSYAKVSGVTQTLKISDLVEDALNMNAAALTRHEVEVVREFSDIPPVTIDKHKVLQVLVNLIRNAKYACDESNEVGKRITVRLSHGEGRIRIEIGDNGVGIPKENLVRIFNHGFTTRKEGHGFGLHSGALAAKELGGSLQVRSDGVGRGATFTLELPAGWKTGQDLAA